MNYSSKISKIIPVVFLPVFLGIASVAKADFTWNFVEDTVSGTVTGTYLGSWNFDSDSSTSAFGVSTEGGFVSHSGGGWLLMHSNPSMGLSLSAKSRSGNLPWTGTPKAATSVIGDDWGYLANYAYGPTGFTSSTSIGGSFVWTGSSLTSLNFTGSSGSFSIGGTPIVWTASIAAIPEPSQFALVAGLMCVGALGLARRRNATPREATAS